MQRGTAGFLGGVIGGFIKLVIDQIAIFINLSTSTIVYGISRMLFGVGGIYSFFSWIIYILFTGILGFIISKIITRLLTNFLYWGTIAGITIWSLTSNVFVLFGFINPTWSMGVGTGLVNFFSNIVLGIAITYAISISKVESPH